MIQIALDTETTGLHCNKGHRIVEIGCIELINRKISRNIFHSYVNPERHIDESAARITGITNEFLSDKPFFKDIMHKFLNFILNANELIIHNANFDVNFINNELKLAQHKINDIKKYVKIFDTLQYARFIQPGKKNNLNALCNRYNIDTSTRVKHGALLDAELLAKVFLNITSKQKIIRFIKKRSTTIVNKKKDIKLKIIHAKPQEIIQHQTYIKYLKNLHIRS